MEKRNKKKYWIISVLFILMIVLAYFIHKEMNSLSDIGRSKEYSKTITFRKIGQDMFLKSKIWGLTGDHYRIFLSSEDKINPDENKDIVFYELEIYYKQHGEDSLYIYVPSNVRKKDQNIQIGKIKINISNIMLSQLSNYKQLELSRISVYDGIE